MAERDIVAVGEIAERHLGEEAPAPVTKKEDTVHLSSGVVLGLVPVSPTAFAELEERYPDPKIPKVMDETRGREIENPMHPDYKKAVQVNEMRKALAAIDLAVVLGTRLISFPDTMLGPDSEEWRDRLFALGHNERILASSTSRYLLWVKLVAACDAKDMTNLQVAVMRRMGVPERDVNDALKSFPDQQT